MIFFDLVLFGLKFRRPSCDEKLIDLGFCAAESLNGSACTQYRYLQKLFDFPDSVTRPINPAKSASRRFATDGCGLVYGCGPQQCLWWLGRMA